MPTKPARKLLSKVSVPGASAPGIAVAPLTMHSPIHLLIAAAVALLLSACNSTLPEGGEMCYARFLLMDSTAATVLSPWRNGEVLSTHQLPPAVAPATRAVSATSLHAYLALRLGVLDHLVGVLDADYIVAPELKAVIATKAPASADPANADPATKAPASTKSAPPFPAVDGGATLADMGNSQSPNLERIKAARPDLIFASPFENAGYGSLETLGIPIVACADYMETTPLGRAEWMRFYGRLLGCPAQADSLFAAEEAAYTALCSPTQKGQADSKRASSPSHTATPPKSQARSNSAAASSPAPTLLVGKLQGQSWWMPDADSYLARLYADAGFSYAVGPNGNPSSSSSGSLALDFESAYSSFHDADVWLITYAAPEPLTYDALAKEDPRYREFRAFRERRIWACNTLTTPYYDILPFAPSTLLRELRAIATSDSTFAHQYFTPLAAQ